MDWTSLVFDLLDLRSFSNLWYWIALAVTWSTTSHWVLGVPWDMVLRAKRLGGQAEIDFEDMVRVNVNRLTLLADVAGLPMLTFLCFVHTTLAILGFYYHNEFSQAVFLIALPLTFVGALSLWTARKIKANAETGDALRRRMHRHRVFVQIIGMIAIFITAFWGMLQNFNLSLLIDN